MKNVRQLSLNLLLGIVFLIFTNCAQKKTDLASVSLALTSHISIQSISTTSVSQLAAPVVFNITYSDVSTAVLTAAHVILQASGTASCTKEVANVTASGAQVILSDCRGDGVIQFRISAGSAIDLVGTLIEASAMSSAIMIDNSGITSASFFRLPGAYSEIPSSIEVSFPESVQASTVTSADFSLGGTCSGVTLDTVSAYETSAVVTLLGTSGCSVGETVDLILDNDGVVDSAANDGVGTSIATYIVTDTGPTSGIFSPSSSLVMSNFNMFYLALPGFIDTETVEVADFVVTGTCSSAYVATVSMAGSDASIQLLGVEGCANSQTVIITTDLSGIDDVSGNPGAGSISVTYTIDNVPPVVTLSILGDILPTLPSTLDVVFSSDTNMSTVSSAQFEISGDCSAILDSVSILNRTATLNLIGTNLCLTGGTVIITVKLDGVSDQTGNTSSGTVIETYTQQ